MHKLDQETQAVIRFVMSSVLLSLLASVWGWWHPLVLLDENQILYIYSTAAQVVAGVFGLTITGFLFLRNELERQRQLDETIGESIEQLRQQYFNLTTFVCIIATLTILACLVTIGVEDSGRSALTVVLLNTTAAIILVTLVAIVYFIVDIINPRRIEEVSNALKRENEEGGGGDQGHVGRFLQLCSRMDRHLAHFAQPFVQERSAGQAPPLSSRRATELLRVNGLIDTETRDHLLRVLRVRNSMLHGSEFSVTPQDGSVGTKCVGRA